MQSNRALQRAISSHDAIVSDVTFTDYAYWRVTFNCAPGLRLSVLVCDTYLSKEEAVEQAVVTLGQQTGQRVRTPR